MEIIKNNNFVHISLDELQEIDGGGFVAFIYALGFLAGTTPLAVCVGAGIVLVGTGACIYGILTH